MKNTAIETAGAIEARADFTVDAAELHKAAAFLASRIVDRRQTVPALASIHIEATPDGRAILTATNAETWASLTLPAEVDSPGAFCTLAKPFADALAKVKRSSAGARARVNATADKPVLTCGRAKVALRMVDAADFPLAPTVGIQERATLSGEYDGARLVADLAALAPAMSKGDYSRPELEGVALQARNMAGRPRLVAVATDSSNLAAAARDVPAGLEAWADFILPRGAVEAVAKAGKLIDWTAPARLSRVTMPGNGDGLAIECGPLVMVAKAIDADFPQWERVFSGPLFAPTGETEPCLFPDLLPGAPTGAMETLAKAAPGAIEWEPTAGGLIGTAIGDPGMVYAVARGALSYTGRKGFAFTVDSSEARAYLEALASAKGLPTLADLEARCEAINAEWGDKADMSSEQRLAIMNSRAPFGEAGTGEYRPGYGDKTGLSNGLQKVGGRVVGLTVGAWHYRRGWSETVTDWEALCEREVYHPETIEPVEGSYSILMPADGPQPVATAPHYVDAADGRRYLVADDERKIHLSKEQLRALIGESCFEVMEVPIPDNHPLWRVFRGYPAYVARWLYEQGDSRLLIVQRDGRCFDPKKYARDYLLRSEIDALIAGTWSPGDETATPTLASLAEAVAAEPEAPAVESEPVAIPHGMGPSKPGALRYRPMTDPTLPDGHAWHETYDCHTGEVEWSMMTQGEARSRCEQMNRERITAPADTPTVETEAPAFDPDGKAWRKACMSGSSAKLRYRKAKSEWEAAQEPQERESEPVAAAQVAPEPENAPSGPEIGDAGHSEPTGDPVAAIRARMTEIEALLASLPAETDRGAIEAIRPKRTAAHERAIRRAWAERKARRVAMAALNRASDERRALRKERDDWEGRAQRNHAKRRRAVLLARGLQKRLNAEYRLVDRNAARMRDAENKALLQESRANVLAAQLAKAGEDIAALQRRAIAAEGENAELWQEIEALTAPAPQSLAA